ncbi:glycosyltransferase family 4 protein [Rhodococcus sp. NPDC056743]|uniref:glycosyltransferase family 4 protein n=1 Tax=Rhodococcus sp. NPDC056743 TaxID=3345934 RepID=UPI003671B041
MTRTLIFVSHTGEVSGAELVMIQVMTLARERGSRVILACPNGPLRERVTDICEVVELPALGLRGESGVSRILGIATVAKNWRIAGRVIAARASAENAKVIVNSLFALPAIRLGRARGGATWLIHDTLSSAKQNIVVRIARPSIRRAVAVSGPTAIPVRALGIPTSVARLGVAVPSDAAKIQSPARRIVGIIGSITPWKGHTVLLEAIARIPDVHLEIGGVPFPGDEQYAEALRTRAEESDLLGRVKFLGYVDSLATLRNWDLAISASTSPEASPLVVLEAMSVGVAVIGTDHGGTRELLAGGAGSLIPVDDPSRLASEITRLLDDEKARSAFARAGREKVVDRYDIQKNLPALLEELIHD